jgi:hypothetical protein
VIDTYSKFKISVKEFDQVYMFVLAKNGEVHIDNDDRVIGSWKIMDDYFYLSITNSLLSKDSSWRRMSLVDSRKVIDTITEEELLSE